MATNWRLCVGDMAVPLERVSKELLEDDSSKTDLAMLSLTKRAGDYKFIEQFLGLPAQTFRRNQWDLVLDMQQALLDKRKAILTVKRASRRPTAVVNVTVRGREVLMQNCMHFVDIFFRPGEEKEGVDWVLAELQKDFQALESKEGFAQLMKKSDKKAGKRSSESLSSGTPVSKESKRPNALSSEDFAAPGGEGSSKA